MNTVATVGHLFPHGVTVGCDVVHLSDALRFSLGRFSVCYWAGTGGTAAHQHPPLPQLPLCSGNYLAFWGPTTEEPPAPTRAVQIG